MISTSKTFATQQKKSWQTVYNFMPIKRSEHFQREETKQIKLQ